MKIDPNNDYKKYFDKISPDNRLIEDTKKKMMEELNSTVYKEKNHIVVYRKIAAAAACFAIVGSAVVMVPKLRNAPVSTKKNPSVQINQSESTSVTSIAESEKSLSTSVYSKINEQVSKKTSVEPAVTSAYTNAGTSKSVSASSVEASVNNGRPVTSAKVTEKPVTESKTKETEAVSEAPVSSNVSEKPVSEVKTSSSNNIETSFHGIGGSENYTHSEETSSESSIIIRQVDGFDYTINLISNVISPKLGEDRNKTVKTEYFRKQNGIDEIIPLIEDMVSSTGFDNKDVIPMGFISSEDFNDIYLECTSNDMVFEFNPFNSGAGEEKFISFAVSKNGEIGNIMKPIGSLCVTDLKGIDNSVFSDDGMFIGYIPSASCYCVSFDINGLKYRILFNGYEFDDVIDYILPFIQNLTEK